MARYKDQLEWRKALAEEREENCWALAKVIDEQGKKIKKLKDEIEELKERVEDSDRWEDYRWERWLETAKQLLKIKCVLNDEDYPYEK